MKKAVVIGGGAAGLMAAGRMARRGIDCTVVEKNDRPARKVMITGKGRCNVTNCCDNDTLLANVRRNSRFLYSAFAHMSSADVMDFFEGQGVPLKVERGNRVFPVSDKASDIVDALVRFSSKGGAKTVKGEAQSLILKDGAVRGVTLCDGVSLAADAVIIATGGLSYPGTGSTGDGYCLARSAGHTVVPPEPSLIPLETHEGWVSDLQGLSLRNTAIELIDNKKHKTVYRDMGEMLFTHFGVSGPMILSASCHLTDFESERYSVKIDLKPALDADRLDARIVRDFGENLNRDFINSLGGLLPRRLIPVIVKLSGIAPNTKVNQITRAERRALAALIKGLTVTVTARRPIEEAIITSGGVSVREINPKTMESKLCAGLYFAGEVIDVDAYTGGFNLQIAFSTGSLAGSSALAE